MNNFLFGLRPSHVGGYDLNMKRFADIEPKTAQTIPLTRLIIALFKNGFYFDYHLLS